jgi:uncharacterized phage protein (TIGR02218 family)
MKAATPGMALHLVQPLTTMAKCCRVQWQNGTVLAFTSFDEALVIEGDTYTPMPGMQDFAVQTHSSLAVGNTDIMGAIDDDTIKAEDIEAGLWDFAEVRFFEVNWQDLSLGQLKLRRGWVGEIKLARTLYVAELRGLMQALVREIGDTISTTCQADLGDARCKVDLAPLTVTGTVTSIADNRRIFGDSGRTEAEHWFDQGVLTFLTGQNVGRRIEVEYFSPTNDFVLFLPMRHVIQVGDQYSVYPGCSKSLADCRDKFNNVPNNRSYPFAAISDQLLSYPDSHV